MSILREENGCEGFELVLRRAPSMMDRGIHGFQTPECLIAAAGAFLSRAPKTTCASPVSPRSRSITLQECEATQIGKPTLAAPRAAFPWLLRKVRYFDTRQVETWFS